jgi:hypothetical protein
MKSTFILILLALLGYITPKTTFKVYYQKDRIKPNIKITVDGKKPLKVSFGSKEIQVDHIYAYIDRHPFFIWRKAYCLNIVDNPKVDPCWKESDEMVNDMAAFFGHKKVKYNMMDVFVIWDSKKKPEHPTESEFLYNATELENLNIVKDDEYLNFLE